MKILLKILLSLGLFISFLNVSALTANTWSSNSWVMTQTQVDLFKLNWVKVVYNDELLLNFNHELYQTDWVPVELRITDKENNLNTINIDTNTVSWSTLNVKLITPLLTNHKYEVIVIQLFDINIKTIWEWVNASKIFTTPSVFDVKPIIPTTNSWTSVDLNSAADVNLNSLFKDVIPTEQAPKKEAIVTKEVSINNIANTFDTAKNTKRLPTTWPTEWLLLAIALFFWLIYFTFKSKNKI